MKHSNQGTVHSLPLHIGILDFLRNRSRDHIYDPSLITTKVSVPVWDKIRRQWDSPPPAKPTSKSYVFDVGPGGVALQHDEEPCSLQVGLPLPHSCNGQGRPPLPCFLWFWLRPLFLFYSGLGFGVRVGNLSAFVVNAPPSLTFRRIFSVLTILVGIWHTSFVLPASDPSCFRLPFSGNLMFAKCCSRIG